MKYSPDELLELASTDGGRFYNADIESAYAFCKKLTLSHYENFPVGSMLFPKNIRQHIFAIYSFARIADDIADEMTDEPIDKRIETLSNYENLINGKVEGNPIFMALQNTIREMALPVLPFQKLLIAFKRDILFRQAETIDDLVDYCSFSANPVGELILRLFGLYNETTAPLSDKICTALQLTNFWQDFSIDLGKNRLFIPNIYIQKYNLIKDNLLETKNSSKLLLCLTELFDFTGKLFDEGKLLIPYLKPFRLKMEIKATVTGGEAVLKKIRKNGLNTINSRPKLLLNDIIKIFFKSIFT